MDALPYLAFQTFVFDLDSVLERQGLKVESCSYVRTAPVKPFGTQPKKELKSKNLGACLFENALQSFSSPGLQGVVKARVWFPSDAVGQAPRSVYLTWRPVQIYEAPTRLNQLLFVLPEYWKHLQNNVDLLQKFSKHFFDNEVVLWSAENIPLSAWTGSSASAKILAVSDSDPVFSQMRFKMYAPNQGAWGSVKGDFSLAVYNESRTAQKTVFKTQFSTQFKLFSKEPLIVNFSGEAK